MTRHIKIDRLEYNGVTVVVHYDGDQTWTISDDARVRLPSHLDHQPTWQEVMDWWTSATKPMVALDLDSDGYIQRARFYEGP